MNCLLLLLLLLLRLLTLFHCALLPPVLLLALHTANVAVQIFCALKEYAKEIGSAYIETSSKDNINVHKAFEYIARMPWRPLSHGLCILGIWSPICVLHTKDYVCV